VSITYRLGDTRAEVSLDRLPDGKIRALIHDAHSERTIEIHAQPLGEGVVLLTLGDQQIIAYTASVDGSRFVWLNGESFTFTRETQDVARRGKRGAIIAGGGQIVAPMPGQVRDVLVDVGDTVERGQTLMLLEAMKMELKITAPFDGMVSRLNVSQGEVVQRGQVLGEVTPAE
jgi:acetyl/propionyl-CoA carboxylase alpha subunit